jgi:hypothetical protein
VSTNDASEFIFSLPNGFNAFYLADANGNRLNAANASIAFGGGITNAPNGPPEVNNPISCLTCHQDGQVGGLTNKLENQVGGHPGKPYTDHLLNGNLQKDREFFSTNAEYQRDATNCSNVFRNSLIRSGSCIPDTDPKRVGQCARVMPDFVSKYREALDEKGVAEELGLCGNSLTNEAANQQSCANIQLPPQLKSFMNASANNQGALRIDRGRFEDNFCRMKQLATAGAPQVAGPQASPGTAVPNPGGIPGQNHAANGPFTARRPTAQ